MKAKFYFIYFRIEFLIPICNPSGYSLQSFKETQGSSSPSASEIQCFLYAFIKKNVGSLVKVESIEANIATMKETRKKQTI